MEKIPSHSELSSRSMRARRPAVFAMLVGLVLGMTFIGVGRFLSAYEGASAAKIAVIFAFAVFAGLLVSLLRRFCSGDELEVLINQRGVVFAFIAVIVGLVAMELLQSAALIPSFAWTNKKLILVLAVFAGGGTLLSKRRYN